MPTKERRQHARIGLDRPVKMLCELTGRFFNGRTWDVSAGGALIEINSPSLLVPGQQVRVAVDWTGHTGVVEKRDMSYATVVRSFGTGVRQAAAVQFSSPQRLAAAG